MYGKRCIECNKKIICSLNNTLELYKMSFNNDRIALKQLCSGLCVWSLEHEFTCDPYSRYAHKSYLHICASCFVETLKHPYVAALVDDNGISPLHEAALSFKETIHHPYFTKARDSNGLTPLHYYIKHFPEEALNHPEVATLQDYLKRTPLHFYVFNTDDIDTLNKVFDLPQSKPNKNGWTAQQLAEIRIKKIRSNKNEPF